MDKKKISLKNIGIDKILLLFAAGILMMLGSGVKICGEADKSPETIAKETEDIKEYNSSLEEGLTTMIEAIQGVESARVMITLKSSGEKIVLKDNPYETQNSVENNGKDNITEKKYIYSDTSVMVTDESGNTRPYVIKELEPEIQGVAVVYSGKPSADITYKITVIVKSLFGIEAHKISVVEQ